jgi:hypothetical protein
LGISGNGANSTRRFRQPDACDLRRAALITLLGVEIVNLKLQKLPLFNPVSLKLCEKKFQIFQIFENDFRKLLIINKRKAEPEGFEPSVGF